MKKPYRDAEKRARGDRASAATPREVAEQLGLAQGDADDLSSRALAQMTKQMRGWEP